MPDNWLLKVSAFAFVIFLVALLAWLTLSGEDDPCADPQADISAAVLAGDAGDQDALVNRAIIMRGRCAKKGDEEGREPSDQ